jgi:hypothetical protein
MSQIENTLWADLMREPGADVTLAVRQPPARPRRSSRASLAAGGGAALIAAILAVLLLTAGTHTTPAYAVALNGDGSVTLTLNELLGVSGANEELSKLGIPVVIARVEPGCTATGEAIESSPPHEIVEATRVGNGFGGLRWIIRPGAIPPGDTVQVSAQYTNDGKSEPVGVAGAWGLFRGRAPNCRAPESGAP